MKHIVVLSGAGMSAESGISTFRDTGGLWEKYPIEQVATPEGFAQDAELVLRFYNDRRRQLLTVEPNQGHRILAEMERDFRISIVTQNVDNLHERAGSTHVIHLHGELMKACSSRDPHDRRYIEELSADRCDIQVGDKASDGSQLRPFIVWFGEAVPEIERAAGVVAQADILVVIGTSLHVYPAAGLLHDAPAKAPVYLIDPNEVQVAVSRPVHYIRKGASEGVAELRELLSGLHQ